MKRNGYILIIMAVLLEIPPVWLLIAGRFDLMCLVTHVASSFIAAIALSPSISRPLKTSPLVAHGILLAAGSSFPGIGLAFCLWLVRAVSTLEQHRPPQINYIEGDRFENQTQEESSLSPVRDSIVRILNSPDPMTRRNAVLSLRGIAEPEVVDLLERAVRDSDEYVRSYAQNHLQKLTQSIEATIKSLSVRTTSSQAPARARVDLAQQYLEWVMLNLAGTETAPLLLKKALASLENLPIDTPEGWEAACLRVECHLQLGEGEAAQTALDSLLSAGFPPRASRAWQLEIHYLTRRWSEFFPLLSESLANDPSPEIRKLARFWTLEQDAA